MKKYLSKCIRILLFSLAFFSCHRDALNNDLESVFDKWSGRADPLKLTLFKSSEVDSTGESLNILSTVIDSISKDISQNSKLNKYVDSLFSIDPLMRKTHLGIAFHAYLNGKDIHDPENLVKANKVLNYYWGIQSKEYEKINEQLASENYRSINKGDSLFLMLPVRTLFGVRSTFFYLGYPYSNKYETAEDSLAIKAILTDKFYGRKTDSTIDSSCLTFKIRIVEMSDTGVRIMTKKRGINDEFDFCLQSYGRSIKHW